MTALRRSTCARGLCALVVATATVAALLASTVSSPAPARAASTAPGRMNCANGWVLCPDIYDAYAFGGYVGHDEPSLLFYSNEPGSGNQMAYHLRLPTDPPTAPPAGTDNFQLHVALWFGMAMCATQSYPEQLSTCTPDSDTNIVDPAVSPKHPGTAFMEMQFYPPGWAPWPAGDSCAATQWCAALNIDSYAQNPVNNTQLNSACAAHVGVEYVNFAFITHDGHAQAPANPVEATTATYTPDPTRDLFMNSGDQISVTMHDTASGLQIVIDDLTTGQSGSMTASAANGFGQVEYKPDPSTECTNLPYDFHPMYSTSSEQTRVPWAAHSYNIAFADEIGHFDYCSNVPAPTANCTSTATEGVPGDRESSDVDDGYCFPAVSLTLVPVSGCLGTNGGFDGTSYQPDWPDGNFTLHPAPIVFSSPRTGSTYSDRYPRVAFEADLPRIEANDISTSSYPCNMLSGANCTLTPLTDDNMPVTFYPFFSEAQQSGPCIWMIGNDIPGVTTYDFGQTAQFGKILQLTYTNGGGVERLYEDFRQVLAPNPCT